MKSQKFIAVFAPPVHHAGFSVPSGTNSVLTITDCCLVIILVNFDLDEVRIRDAQVSPHDMILPLARGLLPTELPRSQVGSDFFHETFLIHPSSRAERTFADSKKAFDLLLQPWDRVCCESLELFGVLLYEFSQCGLHCLTGFDSHIC